MKAQPLQENAVIIKNTISVIIGTVSHECVICIEPKFIRQKYLKTVADGNVEEYKTENGTENNKNEAVVREKEEEEDDDDYEWEYFYEDVDIKDDKLNDGKNKVKSPIPREKIKSPIPKRLEALAKPSTSNQIKIGQVINEGAIKISKDASSPAVNATPQPGPSGKSQRVDPRDGWECPTCTLLNEPKRPGCEACTTERPADYVIPPPGPADTIPRNSTINTAAGGAPKAVANSNLKTPANKEAPTLKVVAATVTKTESTAKASGATGTKVNSKSLQKYE